MIKTVEDHLKNIESRLGETIESLVVARKINELCNPEVDIKLYDIINSRGGFWQAVLVSLQTTLITGINALLDKHSDDSATLYLVLKELEASSPGVIPSNLEGDLDLIRERYKKYRHKLFGHNDKNRDKFADQFNNAGFTWESFSKDLSELEYAFKLLWAVMRGSPVPSKDDAVSMIFPYNDSVKRAEIHTSAFLSDINV